MNTRGPLTTWIAGALGVACLAVAATACGSASPAATASGHPRSSSTTAHHATGTTKATRTTTVSSTATSVSSTATSQGGNAIKPATKVVYLAPVDGQGNIVAGLSVTSTVKAQTCFAGSEGVTTTVAYRCFTTRFIYDPCWAAKSSTHSVICMNFPWSKTVTRVDAPSLGGPGSVSGGLDHPWGVELTDGQQCIAAQGARLVVGKDYGSYECGFTASALTLLDTPNRTGSVWTFRSVYVTSTGKIVAGPTAKVATAFYGESHE